jgi:hypothetical protein
MAGAHDEHLRHGGAPPRSRRYAWVGDGAYHPSVRPSVVAGSIDRRHVRRSLPRHGNRAARTRPVVGHARSVSGPPSICLPAGWPTYVRPGRQKARQNRPSLALYMCGVGRSPQSAWKMLNLLRVEHGIGRRQCDTRNYKCQICTIVSRVILLLLHHHTIEYY